MSRVPPRSLEAALAHVRNGGRLVVPTHTRCTVITQDSIDRWDATGRPLLREEGDGYRMRQGRRGSVYLLPGQLTMVD